LSLTLSKRRGEVLLEDTIAPEDLYLRLSKTLQDREYEHSLNSLDLRTIFPPSPPGLRAITPLSDCQGPEIYEDPTETSYASNLQNLREIEEACCEELKRFGAIPVTTIDALEAFAFQSVPTYEARLPWHGSSETSDENIVHTSALQKQLSVWWHFQKAQWYYRGILDDEEGFAVFRESRRRVDIHLDDYDLNPADDSYEDKLRAIWSPPTNQSSENEIHNLTTREQFVKNHIAAYDFKCSLDLKQNPLQQSQWTNWLEYLSHEVVSFV
jgi:hypothetical protein